MNEGLRAWLAPVDQPHENFVFPEKFFLEATHCEQRFEVFFYFVCFAIIAGAAFAMMWSNIQSINVEMNKPKPRHPEAPDPGDEVMYVDLTREKLEDLYKE